MRSSGFSRVIILLLLSSLLFSMFNVKFWRHEGQVIKWDVLEYYGYLPATFIYNDLTLKFTEQPGEDWGKKIWALTAPNGNKVFKMTMGMSAMYAPFFGVAHGYAKLSGSEANGYSSPYKFALLMSSLFYLFLGLLFLRKTLLLFFNDIITGLTLLAVVAGTNLWYYGSFEAPMSHAYSFSLIAAFIWMVVSFYRKPEVKTSVGLGLLYGLICLIRPSNAIVLLFFLFYGITKVSDVRDRFSYLFLHYRAILLFGVCSFLVWMPQFLYWHMQTGKWFYFSYAENGAFYFSSPQIFNGLFSYRKGWFLYTPVMLVALLAIPLCRKYAPSLTIPLMLFVPLNIYIILSWWCWWYGGCFGQRAFIDSYALMAFPLAAFMQWLTEHVGWKKVTGFAIISFCVGLSIFYTSKYYYGSIHWDSNTRDSYWESFGRLRPGPEFYQLIKEPDYDKARRGEKEY